LVEEIKEPLSFAKEPYVRKGLWKKNSLGKEHYSCRALVAEKAFSFAKEPYVCMTIL